MLIDIIIPTLCPSCSSRLVFNLSDAIVQRYCDNSSCPGKAAAQFAYVGKRETLEIDNLGDSMAAELVENGITDLGQLFEFGNEMYHGTAKNLHHYNFRSHVNTMKMVKSLETAKTATWERWIASLGIDTIGHTLGKVIAKELALASDGMENLPVLLATLSTRQVAGLGPVKSKAIAEWANSPNNISLCKSLYDARVRPTPLVNPASSGGVLSGVQFCITGGFTLGPRPTITAQLEKLGAVAHSSVNKKCNLVIVGDGAGSKLDKAKSMGIKTVGEEWLEGYIK